VFSHEPPFPDHTEFRIGDPFSVFSGETSIEV
jgi:hypothetical protein